MVLTILLVCKYSVPSLRLSFTLLIISFAVQKPFSLDHLSLSFFLSLSLSLFLFLSFFLFCFSCLFLVLLKAREEGNGKGWDGWMASPTQWTWVWVDSRSWWWTGKPGVLQFMGSQRVKCNWVTELNFDVITLKYLSRLTLWRFLLYFLPGVPPKTRTLWVDFCVWCKRRGQFYSLACCCPVFPALFVKVTILSPLCSPGILVKDLLTTYIWV